MLTLQMYCELHFQFCWAHEIHEILVKYPVLI
jgi:hypothetical protein